MPKVTVYIREEDYPKWRNIEKKTEFIASALEEVVGLHETPVEGLKVKLPILKGLPEEFKGEFCKHFAARGFCKNVKCIYSQFDTRNKEYIQAQIAMDANEQGGLDFSRVGK